MKPSADLLDLLTAYQTCREPGALMRTFAAHLGSSLGARTVFVWISDPARRELASHAAWHEPGTHIEPTHRPVAKGFLAEVIASGRAQRFSSSEIHPQNLTHLDENDRPKVRNALYAPIPASRGPRGAVEVLNRGGGDFTPDDAALTEEACRLTGRALEALEIVEQERREGLATVERLTALYDISRVFNSTLELNEFLPVAVEKIRDILGAQACNAWLADSKSGDLYLAQQGGTDPTAEREVRILFGEGIIGQVAQEGQPRLVESAEDEPSLQIRRGVVKGFRLRTLMWAPLVKGEQVLGVVEVVNKLDGEAFDEDDLFFLASISEQAAIALNNANLLEAERRVHDLDALLATSKELTSTLNLDHVLTTVVHQASTVVPFNRCVIGLYDRGQFVLGAVSGEAGVPKTPEMEGLRGILEWVAGQESAVSASQREDGWTIEPQDDNQNLRRFLEESGSRGFYAVPLRDDQGTVGVLALLNDEPDFLSQNHLEILTILASQTTVAVRNARLYQEVPLVNLWQPFLKRKQQLQQVPASRWRQFGWRAAAVVLPLVIIPWKLRIETSAAVIPAQRRIVSAEVQGVIERVLVHEGERVRAGDALAILDSSDNTVRLQQSRTALALSRQQLAEAESKRDWTSANQARLNVDSHQAEVNLYQERVGEACLVAPITGVIVTPKVEEKTGQLLKIGDPFCELVDTDRLAVDMNVGETDLPWIKPGAKVALKLNSFPTRTIIGRVNLVSPETTHAEGERFFVARAVFPNPDGQVRTGMAGEAKISASGGWLESGWYPVGYVILRAPARWVWRKTWSLLP